MSLKIRLVLRMINETQTTNLYLDRATSALSIASSNHSMRCEQPCKIGIFNSQKSDISI